MGSWACLEALDTLGPGPVVGKANSDSAMKLKQGAHGIIELLHMPKVSQTGPGFLFLFLILICFAATMLRA